MTREDALIIANAIGPKDERFRLTSLTLDADGMWIAAYTNPQPDPMEVILERWPDEPDEDANEDEVTDTTGTTDTTEVVEGESADV